MEIIAVYKTIIQAEEDSTFLTHKGIASIVHGDFSPEAMGKYFSQPPIVLAVQEMQKEQAEELLRQKYYPALPPTTLPPELENKII